MTITVQPNFDTGGYKITWDAGSTGPAPISGFKRRSPLAVYDFETGSGTGTLALEVLVGGDWLSVAEVISTGSPGQDEIPDLSQVPRVVTVRWNCTEITAGAITAYLW